MAMTASEKARFDCQGFLLRPGVLDAATVAELREAVDVMEHAPHTLPPHQRRCPGGCTGSAQSLFSLCLSLSLSLSVSVFLSGDVFSLPSYPLWYRGAGGGLEQAQAS